MPQEKIGRLVRTPTGGGGVKLVYPGQFTGKRLIGPPEAVPVFYEDWIIAAVDTKKRTPKYGSVTSRHKWTSFRVELTTNGRPASKPSD